MVLILPPLCFSYYNFLFIVPLHICHCVLPLVNGLLSRMYKNVAKFAMSPPNYLIKMLTTAKFPIGP